MSMIRSQISIQRKALTAAQVDEMSRLTISRFLRDCGVAPEAWNGLKIGLYRSLPGELDLRPLESRLFAMHAHFCFPGILIARAGLMEFAWGGAGAAATWVPGPLNFEEPPATQPSADPSRLDVIFVPGVVFGEQ